MIMMYVYMNDLTCSTTSEIYYKRVRTLVRTITFRALLSGS